jgi:hypothetical protein
MEDQTPPTRPDRTDGAQLSRRRGDVIDLHHLGYWLIAVALFVVVPVLTTRRSLVRRLAGDRMSRLGHWALERLEEVPEVDPLVTELYLARRRERLYADIARLERILATDENMSATRQLGNRIAYDWLVAELERTRRVPQTIFAEVVPDRWDSPALSPSRSSVPIGHDPQRGTTVEVLDIGWR